MRWDNATAVAVGVLTKSSTRGADMELEPANWKPLELLIGSRCVEFM